MAVTTLHATLVRRSAKERMKSFALGVRCALSSGHGDERLRDEEDERKKGRRKEA